MLRGHESRPHCHDTVLWYAVTLQVCSHPKTSLRLWTYTKKFVDVLQLAEKAESSFTKITVYFSNTRLKTKRFLLQNLNQNHIATELLTEICSWITSFILPISLRWLQLRIVYFGVGHGQFLRTVCWLLRLLYSLKCKYKSFGPVTSQLNERN